MQLKNKFINHSSCKFEENISNMKSFYESSIMISDWSGAAIEYALGLEKPVIFVDVPRKVHNLNYEDISQVPIEVMLRQEVGEVISPDDLLDIPAAVERLCKNPEDWKLRLRGLRSQWVYNIGKSAETMADHIANVSESAEANIKEAR